jgi:histidinol-phosphate/aromatic aminotransferase/cobyric acid decarboxylase-like protein
LGPPPTAIAAIKLHLEQLNSYPDPTYRQLRESIAEYHGLAPEWILPGNGAAELLTWSGWELSRLETTFILTPGFGDYWRALKTFGARILTCSLLNETGIGDLDFALRYLPTAIPHPLGLLLNNPHNPTGQIFRRETIIPYLEKFALVVVDESFMDFLLPSEQQSVLDLVPTYPNLVVLRSLTKFYSLPGLRLGYAIADPQRLERWQHWRDPWPVNTLAVAAAEAILKNDDFAHITWDWLQPAKDQLFAGLSSIEGLHPYPSAANFFLVRCDVSGSKLQHELLANHRILIRDCLSFPELQDSFFRVAIKREEDNALLIAGLRECLHRLMG